MYDQNALGTNLTEISYRQLVTGHPLLIMEIDNSGTIVFANRTSPDLSADCVAGSNLLSLVSSTDTALLGKMIKNIQQGAVKESARIMLPGNTSGTLPYQVHMGPLLEKKTVERILLVLSPIRTLRTPKPDDIVDPVIIRSHLLNALIAHETIDVQMDNCPEVFSSLLLPFAPNTTENPKNDNDFIPGGYLSAKSHLLLCPLEPSYGNIRIRKTNEVLLTFHYEEESFLGTVSFQSVLQGKEGHALRTSFPTALERFKKRGVKRIKIPFGMTVKVKVTPLNGTMFEAQMGDISEKGLSYFYPQGMEPIKLDTDVDLSINMGNGKMLELMGVVCNTFTARDAENQYALRKKGGVEFLKIVHPDTKKKLEWFLDKCDKSFKLFLENKQRKYAF